MKKQKKEKPVDIYYLYSNSPLMRFTLFLNDSLTMNFTDEKEQETLLWYLDIIKKDRAYKRKEKLSKKWYKALVNYVSSRDKDLTYTKYLLGLKYVLIDLCFDGLSLDSIR